MKTMKEIITQYPLVMFFIMAVLFSWISVIPRILNQGLPLEPFLVLGAFLGPTLSAVIVIILVEGKLGLVRFFKRYTQWRAGILWWLITTFGILFALNVVATLFLGPMVLIEFTHNFRSVLTTYLITLIFGIVLGPLWEEGGWRGFALPRLQERYGPFTGSIILGAIWAFWHMPGYLGGWMTTEFPALLIYCIGFSILATWVYNNTRGSILLMILFHASSNAGILVGTMVLPANLPVQMSAFVFSGWIPAVMIGLAAGLILVITQDNLAYQRTWQT